MATSSADSPSTARTATTWRSRARAALCAPTARRGSSGSDCWRCCWPSARVIGRQRPSVPLMLLDDVMSELDRERRAALVELLAEDGGQALITTTDLDHVPGVFAPGVARIAVDDGQDRRRADRGCGRAMTPAPPLAAPDRRRARSDARRTWQPPSPLGRAQTAWDEIGRVWDGRRSASTGPTSWSAHGWSASRGEC